MHRMFKRVTGMSFYSFCCTGSVLFYSVVWTDYDKNDWTVCFIDTITVYKHIDAYYNNNFPGGQSVVLDAKVNGIGLPMETSRFKNFTKDEYDVIYQKLVAGSINILKDTDADSVNKLPLNIVKVNFIQ